ncbi:MAG: TrmH family RNA methyltransferase [Lachnospiraceae bacterium]|nr:TrmH family RNA methyltransferase [Lachnospiraceae bacterium]
MSRDDRSFENNILNRISPSDIRKYKKEAGYSYTLGAFPTLELVDAMPERVVEVLVHSSFTEKDMIIEKCRKASEKPIDDKPGKAWEKTIGDKPGKASEKPNGGKQGKAPEDALGGKTAYPGKMIPVRQDDKLIEKLSDKENVYVVGVFEKYRCSLKEDMRHLVLVNPSNMGNLGTIIRTACGFGYYDLAIIEPAADIFNPKTVRASMGSLFRVRHELFTDFEEYLAKYCSGNNRMLYPFMLDGSCSLNDAPVPENDRFALIFGNEATGLPKSFSGYGCPVRIEQTEFVDSLNLTIAAGIGMYVFGKFTHNS